MRSITGIGLGSLLESLAFLLSARILRLRYGDNPNDVGVPIIGYSHCFDVSFTADTTLSDGSDVVVGYLTMVLCFCAVGFVVFADACDEDDCSPSLRSCKCVSTLTDGSCRRCSPHVASLRDYVL